MWTTHDKTFKPHVDIESKIIDDEAVLLHIGTGAYFSLNEVGTYIWESFRKGHTVSEIIDFICEEYDIDRSQAKADVCDLTTALIEKHFLTPAND